MGPFGACGLVYDSGVLKKLSPAQLVLLILLGLALWPIALPLLFVWLLIKSKPRPEASRPPYIRDAKNQKLINFWWSKIFYNNENLKALAGTSPIYTRPGFGLVYCYVVADTVRYVGQTREESLKWRMTRRQKNGHIGYRPAVKRCLINAYRAGSLGIETKLVPLAKLDQQEQALIADYSPTNRLWNIDHNPHFHPRNYLS